MSCVEATNQVSESGMERRLWRMCRQESRPLGCSAMWINLRLQEGERGYASRPSKRWINSSGIEETLTDRSAGKNHILYNNANRDGTCKIT